MRSITRSCPSTLSVSLVSDHAPSCLIASRTTHPVALAPVAEKPSDARPVAPLVEIEPAG